VGHTAAERPGAADSETWVRAAFDLLTAVPDARRVGLALVEGGGRRLSFTSSDRAHDSVVEWCDVDAYEDVPLNNAVRTGKVIAGSLHELRERYPEFISRQEPSTHAVASVPLSDAGRIVGGFALFFDTEQAFDELQLSHLRRLGERLGADLRRGRPSGPLPGDFSGADTLPPGARVSTCLVAADARGVGPARQFVRSTLEGWGVDRERADVAVLCVSELVTNAIIHTVAGCEVRLVLDHDVLTISVRDGGTTRGHPGSSAEDLLAVHGRGLRLVDALSSRWGSEVGDVGMTVWCELA